MDAGVGVREHDVWEHLDTAHGNRRHASLLADHLSAVQVSGVKVSDIY